MKKKFAIRLVDQTEATEAAFVVCEERTSPLLLPDNRVGVCSHCGVAVQFRPHAPERPKLCFRCGATAIAADTEDSEVVVTHQGLDEVRTYLKKKKH